MARSAAHAATAAVVLGLGALHAAQNGYRYWGSSRFGWSLAFVLLIAVATYGVGLPDVVPARRAPGAALRAVVAGVVGISLLQLLTGTPLLPRFVTIGAALLLIPVFVACAALAERRRSEAVVRDRILFVGAGLDRGEIQAELDVDSEQPAVVAGVVPEEAVMPTPDDPMPLRTVVERMRANVVVLSREVQEDDLVVHQAALLHEAGLRVRTLAMFYEQWLGKIPVSELERFSLMFDISEIHRAVYARASRLLDITLAVFGGVVLAALCPVAVLGNLVANRGPLFYTQPRVGKNGSVFTIYKFRTMRPSGGGLVNEWTVVDDPRITPFGRLMRLSHVDELPQVLNILKGDLSVVGPRPEQPHYVAELVEKLPFYSQRHLVRPGLTGWAQVKYGYAGSETDALQKLQYEFFYLRHQSLVLDLRIVVRTIRAIVGRRGR